MAVKKSSDRNLKVYYNTLEEICQKYDKEAITVNKGKESEKKSFRVGTQIKILREFCYSNGLSYKIEPLTLDVSGPLKTVVASVEVLDSEGVTIWKSFGTCSRYSFSLQGKATDAMAEAVQTIAIGKALCFLGISPIQDQVTYSAEEIELHEAIKEKLDVEEMKSRVLELVAKLPEELKKRARYAGITVENLLDITNIQEDTPQTLAEKVSTYIETRKSTAT